MIEVDPKMEGKGSRRLSAQVHFPSHFLVSSLAEAMG